MAQGEVWEDRVRAETLVRDIKQLKEWIVPFQNAESRFIDASELLLEEDAKSDAALYQELLAELDWVDKQVEELEIRKMLSGELDHHHCFLTINAGAGGTESCDWAAMLCRMYQKWATKRGWVVDIVDRVEGEVAGIKSVTLQIRGGFAYGYCKAEKGVHRLVRISPFDSNARRHTSFASVDVSPEIDEEVDLEIRSEEIEIDTFRASGAGGQHVNTTDSAVRIKHLPTGIIVSCQGERSQLQNKETCFKMLRSRLYEKKVLEREEKLREISGEKKEIAWGSQIRSYVFQPYTLVKDTRTQYEQGNVAGVMDGDLDGFIHAYLKEFG